MGFTGANNNNKNLLNTVSTEGKQIHTVSRLCTRNDFESAEDAAAGAIGGVASAGVVLAAIVDVCMQV